MIFLTLLDQFSFCNIIYLWHFMIHLFHFRLLTSSLANIYFTLGFWLVLANFSGKFNLLVLCEDIESSRGPRSNSVQSFSVCHRNLSDIVNHNFSKISLLNMKILVMCMWGRGVGSIWPPLWFFQKFVFQRKVEALFFGTFNAVISYILSENFVEIPQVVQMSRRLFFLKLTIFTNLIFSNFLVTKTLKTLTYNRWSLPFLPSSYFK